MPETRAHLLHLMVSSIKEQAWESSGIANCEQGDCKLCMVPSDRPILMNEAGILGDRHS